MANTAVDELGLDKRIGDLIAQIEGGIRTPKPSRREIDAFWKDSEFGLFGKMAEAFPRFIYSFNYDAWGGLAKDSPYSRLHEAFEGSYRHLVPEIAAQIKQKGIDRIFSKGPSPEVDKLLLEELVRSEAHVTYQPVDISPEAVEKAMKAVTTYLDSKFGKSWRNFITLGEGRAMSFSEARGNGKACAIYSGGDVMNGIAMWEDARETAGEGGIVVANAAVNADLGDWSSYWLSLYDNPQDHAMFTSGLKEALPGLFSKRNKGKWNLSFSYLPEDSDWARRWGVYQTPAIVAQLDVKEKIDVEITDPVTGNPVKVSFKPRQAGAPPIVLGISTKLDAAGFLRTVPANFGLKQTHYLTEAINHEKNGRRGIVAAAIFEVGKLPVNHVPAYDLAPKMLQA